MRYTLIIREHVADSEKRRKITLGRTQTQILESFMRFISNTDKNMFSFTVERED